MGTRRLRHLDDGWWIADDDDDLWGPYSKREDAKEDKVGLDQFYLHCDDPDFISVCPVDSIPPEKPTEISKPTDLSALGEDA